MIPTPWREPLSYEQITIAGRLWPGICRVEGAERAYEWQVNKGKGADGATTNFQGRDIAKPKLTFVLYEGIDALGGYVNLFAEWDDYKEIFEKSVPSGQIIPLTKEQEAANKIASAKLAAEIAKKSTELHTTEEWSIIQGIRSRNIFFARPTTMKDPIALSVQHPLFDLAKIKAISIAKIGQLTPLPDGSATVTIETIEFNPPKPSGGTPKSATNSAPSTPDRPQTEIERRVDQESKTTQDLLEQAGAP